MRTMFSSVSSMSRASGRGRELEVQRAQSPEQEGRLPLVAAILGRAVVVAVDADVVETVEQPFERDSRLGTPQWRARTRVDSTTERNVLADVGPVQVELVGVLEATGVAIRGAVQDEHIRARRKPEVRDRG